jgi:hypothetical protein
MATSIAMLIRLAIAIPTTSSALSLFATMIVDTFSFEMVAMAGSVTDGSQMLVARLVIQEDEVFIALT